MRVRMWLKCDAGYNVSPILIDQESVFALKTSPEALGHSHQMPKSVDAVCFVAH